jgi:HPt (histidine-containing phosphotransfer) domain-containing protein
MNLQVKDQMDGVLDVEDLLARCLGNLEFAQRILGKFQERCDEDLEALEKAVFARDIDSVARLAHRMKGASANASALGLQKHASEIERAARHQALEEVPASLESLKREWVRFSEVVSEFGSSAETPERSN